LIQNQNFASLNLHEKRAYSTQLKGQASNS
jgi:hypothetical protein